MATHSSILAWPIQALRGLPCLGSFSVVQCIRHIEGPPPGVLQYKSVYQAFDGPVSLLFSCQCWCGGIEAMVMAPPPVHDSAGSPCFHGCLAFLHRHFPPHLFPHVPLVWLSAVNSIPHPGIAPQSLSSSSQQLCLLGDLCSCGGCI